MQKLEGIKAPTFTLTTKDLPELKNWKVGGVYFLKIKVEQTQLGKGENEWETTTKGEKEMHARFQMISLEVLDKKENYEDEYGRKRAAASR